MAPSAGVRVARQLAYESVHFVDAVAPLVRASQDPGGADLGRRAVYLFLLVLLVGVAVLGGAAFTRSELRNRRRRRELAADVERGFAFLERQLADLSASGDPATTDARERLTAARVLARNGSQPPVLRAVRHTLLEGLAAAYCARQAAGLRPGPVPPLPNAAPLTDVPVLVEISGRTYTGLPAYAPGSPYHFAGGTLADTEVPGGWYAEPFWAQLLIVGPQRRPEQAGTHGQAGTHEGGAALPAER